MKKYFEKLQEKPEAHRKKAASIFAGIVTFVILILWVLILVFTKHYFLKEQSGMEQFDELIHKISEQSAQFNTVIEEKEKLSSCVSKTLDSLKQEDGEETQGGAQVAVKSQKECATNDAQETQTDTSKHYETPQGDK